MSDSLLNANERETALARRRAETADAPARQPAALHPVLRLQRQVGNAQVSRMLADRAVMREAEEEELQMKHDPALAQRESEGGEDEEEELQMKHDPALAQRAEEEEELQMKHDPALAQRAGEEEELQMKHDPALAQRAEEEEELQMKHDPQIGLEGGPVGDDMAGRINSQRGSGSTLNDSVRSKMEGAMGAGFGDVRVHRDSESDDLNRGMTAKAFTTGSDIFLRQDQSAGDERLIAHELTHVVQQRT
ncbi:MAG: DUF4157 domain-containing protein, partial [Tepidiformaceae bacterium]